ncbi:MAG TPA: CoA transferase [Streptosporangiaceae bacterium]
MTDAELTASCLPDPRAEREHLVGLLPPGVLPEVLPGLPDSAAGAQQPDRCAVLAWARSGLMQLTGLDAGPPLCPAAPVLTRTGAVAAAITELSGRAGQPVRLDVGHILTVRAALAGLTRRGTESANGSCRILRAADGWLAVSLARPSDLDSLPALLRREPRGDPWHELAAEARARPAAGLAASAQLLGIAAAGLADAGPRARAGTVAPVRITRLGPAGQAPRVVLDLSALWAGPLCASILSSAGWQVIKVEDVRRPDGARSWLPEFYAELHAGARNVTLDFGTTEGRAALASLADDVGVVIEASRPRALRRLGLVAEEWLAARPGRIWVSVTGYGRDDPRHRVAFGDDDAVAGGLVAYWADGTPVFCGDAIADPLTGLHAALAALAAHAAGGGAMVDVAMAGVCAGLVRPTTTPARVHAIRAVGAARWNVEHPGLPPQMVAVP